VSQAVINAMCYTD